MRILIAEDERITRASLARQLEALGHTVVSAEDGAVAGSRAPLYISSMFAPAVSRLMAVESCKAATCCSGVDGASGRGRPTARTWSSTEITYEIPSVPSPGIAG